MVKYKIKVINRRLHPDIVSIRTFTSNSIDLIFTSGNWRIRRKNDKIQLGKNKKTFLLAETTVLDLHPTAVVVIRYTFIFLFVQQIPTI